MTDHLQEIQEQDYEPTASAARRALSAEAKFPVQAGEEGAPLFAKILSSLLKWSAALITLGGLALHVAGFVYQDEYDKAWGLDANMFPKSIEWILITGYYVILTGVAELYLFLKNEWVVLLAWGFVMGSITFVGVWFGIYGREDLPRQLARRWIKRQPKWLIALSFSYGFSGVICLAAFVAPVLVVTLLYFPASLGKDFAKKEVESQLLSFSTSCEKATHKKPYTSIHRENKAELRGFLIESSNELLAIYLPEQKLVRLIPRAGAELSVSPKILLGAFGK